MSQEVMNTLVDMSQEIIKLKDQKRELLEALVKAANFIQPYSIGKDLLEEIDAVIAKAEGGAL